MTLSHRYSCIVTAYNKYPGFLCEHSTNSRNLHCTLQAFFSSSLSFYLNLSRSCSVSLQFSLPLSLYTERKRKTCAPWCDDASKHSTLSRAILAMHSKAREFIDSITILVPCNGNKMKQSSQGISYPDIITQGCFRP